MLLQIVLFCALFVAANAARTPVMNGEPGEPVDPLYPNSSTPPYANVSRLAYAGVARGASTGYYPMSLVTYTILPPTPAGTTAATTTDGAVIYSVPHGGLTTIVPFTAYNYPVRPSSPTTTTMILTTPADATAVETTNSAIVFSMPHAA